MRNFIYSVLLLSLLSAIIFVGYKSPVKTCQELKDNLIAGMNISTNSNSGISVNVYESTFNSGKWDVVISIPENVKDFNLSPLSNIKIQGPCFVFLLIPPCKIPSINHTDIKILYITKRGIGNFDFTALENNESLDQFCFGKMSDKELKSLPGLPKLRTLSLSFEIPSRFDIDILEKYPYLQTLILSNVGEFLKSGKNIRLKSLWLNKCQDYSLVRSIQAEKFIFSQMNIDVNILKTYIKNMPSSLLFRDCKIKESDIELLKNLKDVTVTVIAGKSFRKWQNSKLIESKEIKRLLGKT